MPCEVLVQGVPQFGSVAKLPNDLTSSYSLPEGVDIACVLVGCYYPLAPVRQHIQCNVRRELVRATEFREKFSGDSIVSRVHRGKNLRPARFRFPETPHTREEILRRPRINTNSPSAKTVAPTSENPRPPKTNAPGLTLPHTLPQQSFEFSTHDLPLRSAYNGSVVGRGR